MEFKNNHEKKTGHTPEERIRRRNPKILLRYGLLQIPALAMVILIMMVLERWVVIPSPIFWGIIIAWVAKDIMLYPLVWQAYDWNRKTTKRSMVGERGTAIDRLAPAGYVRVRGELWHAELSGDHRSIEKGAPIHVVDITGLTLSVEPDYHTPD